MHRALVAFVGSLACLCALGCAGETSERPSTASARAAPPTPSPPKPELPLPETAFQPDDTTARAGATSTQAPSVPQSPSRFETRRIGDDAPRGPRFTGRAVNLDLKNADLQEAFRLVADVGKVNIVVSGEVTGTITLKLQNVPWDQALDVIARTKGLTTEREGNIIMVTARKP